MNNSGISFTCDSCGREIFSCTFVNGMKFCAKCYQETFGNQQNKESSELLVNSLVEKDKQIAELQKQLEEKEKIIQMQQNIDRYDIGEMLTENIKLRQQLKSQPAEIVKKIKAYYKTSIYDRPNAHTEVSVLIHRLDTILKEYQK